MVTFLVTSIILSVLVLGLAAIAIYFWQKPANNTETFELPPPPASMGALFADEQARQLTPAAGEQTSAQKQLDEPEVQHDQAQVDALIESWRESPDRQSTARMLHAAALSDDAETYRKAVEIVLRFWREQRIPNLSATELQALFNGEFWILSSSTRNSGAGFLLKRTLSAAKGELERANNASNHQLPPVD